MDDEIRQFPWEATPDVENLPITARAVAVVPKNVELVTETQQHVRRAAKEYVERIAPRLPEAAREGFTRGAGMFDFDSPADLDDQLG